MSEHRVYDLTEAREWFVEHPNDPVSCYRRGDTKEVICESFEQAALFYGNGAFGPTRTPPYDFDRWTWPEEPVDDWTDY